MVALSGLPVLSIAASAVGLVGRIARGDDHRRNPAPRRGGGRFTCGLGLKPGLAKRAPERRLARGGREKIALSRAVAVPDFEEWFVGNIRDVHHGDFGRRRTSHCGSSSGSLALLVPVTITSPSPLPASRHSYRSRPAGGSPPSGIARDRDHPMRRGSSPRSRSRGSS